MNRKKTQKKGKKIRDVLEEKDADENATLPPCSGVWLWRPAACSMMSFSTITSAQEETRTNRL
jgi:hypothetical protein